jgi:photosystem II stability/assembly factor-like uncharacterized protein
MNRHGAGLLAAIFVMSSGSIPGASWRGINSGLPGAIAGASGLAIDPATPSTLYSWGSNGALFKSTDGAASWYIVNGIAGVSWLALHPKNSSAIYAGTRLGLVKSANGGASWASPSIAPTTLSIGPPVLDPQDSNTLYAVTFDSGIIKSTDGGASWKTLPGSQALVRGPTFLAVDPLTPSTLYAVVFSVRSAIFKSIDGGESWVSIKACECVDFAEFIQALAIDPVTPSTIYAPAQLYRGQGSSEEIIYKSTDGGQNWGAFGTGIPTEAVVMSLAIDPGSPSRIYGAYRRDSAGGGWGIIKSTDGGGSWTVMNAGLSPGNFKGSPVVIDPSAPETLYVGHVDQSRTGAGGIFKSTDATASWSPANAGRSLIDVRAVAIDPINAHTVYASIGSDGVFKSADGGGVWVKLAAFQFIAKTDLGLSGRGYTRSLAVDFLRPNILYALTARTDGGCGLVDELLFKSTDSGASWSSASPPMSGCDGFSAITIDPTDPNTLYVSGMDNPEGEAPVIYKSTDAGASWSDRLGVCCGNALVIDPTNPSSLYGGTPSGVLNSIDGGATWTKTGLSTRVDVLALDPANPGVVYAAAGGSGLSGFEGLLKSTDSGANWTPINEGLARLIASRSPVTALVIDSANPQVLYAGTSGYGVFRSTDGGAYWSPFNDGLPNLDIRLLALTPGRPNALYAGTVTGMFVINLAPETIPFRGRSRR